MVKNIIKIIVLCLLMILLMTLTIVVYKNLFEKEEIDTLIINNGEEEKIEEEVVEDSEVSEEDNYVEEEPTSLDNNISSVDDRDPVTYFEDKEREVSKGGSLEDYKGKFKNYFVEIVDFIFYDKEINGYTFDSLSNNAKLKVISIALKIDSMIDNKVPGYKETIWSSGSKVYTNAKGKLVTLYLDISSKVCENKGEECDRAKEIFGEVKTKCKIGWSFIKNLASTSKDKLKSWYEVYRGK